MTKIALGALALLAMTSAADAGPRSYHAAPCTVFFKLETGWKQVNNSCFMGRDYQTNETAVKMGTAILLISRTEEEPDVAKLYTIGAEGQKLFQGTAIAKGACWVGTTVRFCAK